MIDKALEHLLQSGQRAVVVDILVRMNGGPENGFVKIEQGAPEAHSVVLYHNPYASPEEISSAAAASQSHTISVIDPSNLLFSSHLANYTPMISGVRFELKTFHKGIQIYKPGGVIGPNPDQFRDCIDVATKIAMNFNISAIYYDLSDLVQSLLICPVIQSLSNDKKIDDNILSAGSPTRVKQASDHILVEKFAQVQEIVNRNLATMSYILDTSITKPLKAFCNVILAPSAKTHIEIIKELCHHNEVCATHIKDFGDAVYAEHQELSGDIESTI